MNIFKYILILLSALVLLSCGDKKSQSTPDVKTASQPIEVKLEKNAFEAAIDTQNGNKDLWDSFKDNGGLNKLNDLYGLNVTSISASWEGSTKKFKGGLMQALASTTSPKEVRAALSKVCGLEESDWKFRTDYEPTGTATKNGFTCYYIFSNTTVDIVISMKQQLSEDSK